MTRKEPTGYWSAVWVEAKPGDAGAATEAARLESQRAQWLEKKAFEGQRNRYRVERQAMLIRELKAGAEGARRFDIVGELRDMGTNNLDDLLAYLDAPKVAPEPKRRGGQ